MWMAVGGTLSSPIWWDSISSSPAASSALASASMGACHSSVLEDANCKRMPVPVIIPTLGFPGCVKAIVCDEFRQFQPAATSATDNWFMSRTGSGSAWIKKTNGVPAKGRIASIMETICSLEITRGVVSFANSSAASCAFRLASSARALASTAFSSDLRLNSFWRSPAIWPNLISKATPIATKPLAMDDPHWSKTESYGGWKAAIASSATTPITTRAPPNHSQRSHDSMDFSSSSSLALISPFGRRHAGKGFSGFWIGLAVGALIWLLLFALWLGLGMPQ
jgi:hypothetical protein